MKLFKQSDKLNMEEVNEVVSLSKRILHLLYIAMIIATILIVTIIVREWGILNFLLNFFRNASIILFRFYFHYMNKIYATIA